MASTEANSRPGSLRPLSIGVLASNALSSARSVSPKLSVKNLFPSTTPKRLVVFGTGREERFRHKSDPTGKISPTRGIEQKKTQSSKHIQSLDEILKNSLPGQAPSSSTNGNRRQIAYKYDEEDGSGGNFGRLSNLPGKASPNTCAEEGRSAGGNIGRLLPKLAPSSAFDRPHFSSLRKPLPYAGLDSYRRSLTLSTHRSLCGLNTHRSVHEQKVWSSRSQNLSGRRPSLRGCVTVRDALSSEPFLTAVMDYATANFYAEIPLFLKSTMNYMEIENEQLQRNEFMSICSDFIDEDSPHEVNLPYTIRRIILQLKAEGPYWAKLSDQQRRDVFALANAEMERVLLANSGFSLRPSFLVASPLRTRCYTTV